MIYSRLRLVRLSCYWLDTKNKKIIRERQWKTLIVLKSSTLEIRLKVNDGWKSRFYRAFQNSEVLSTRKATWCWFIRKEALILNCSKFHLIFRTIFECGCRSNVWGPHLNFSHLAYGIWREWFRVFLGIRYALCNRRITCYDPIILNLPSAIITQQFICLFWNWPNQPYPFFYQNRYCTRPKRDLDYNLKIPAIRDDPIVDKAIRSFNSFTNFNG